MRHIFVLLLVCLLMTPAALAEEGRNPFDIILDAVSETDPEGVVRDSEFVTVGPWMSVTLHYTGRLTQALEGTQWNGMVFDTATGGRIAWEDLFTDGDAAAARMEALAEASMEDNAYSEYKQVSPIPRDNFTVTESTVTVYYPAEQLSYFSGRSGGFTFYAYELSGLLREDAPVKAGELSSLGAVVDRAFTEGALPGPLADWKLGMPMTAAADALGLVDKADISSDGYTLYRFEAPQTRGAVLLSGAEEVRPEVATIRGVMAEKMDLSGLYAGVSTREACEAALGTPDETTAVEQDPYGRLPAGETLIWRREGRALMLHMVEGVLHSVTLAEG